MLFFFFFQAEDGIRDHCVTGVQTCALPIYNFPRLLDLCRGRLEYVQKEIWGRRATDEETLCEMKNVHERFGYLADPHTAVGVFCWERSEERRVGKECRCRRSP